MRGRVRSRWGPETSGHAAPGPPIPVPGPRGAPWSKNTRLKGWDPGSDPSPLAPSLSPAHRAGVKSRKRYPPSGTSAKKSPAPSSSAHRRVSKPGVVPAPRGRRPWLCPPPSAPPSQPSLSPAQSSPWALGCVPAFSPRPVPGGAGGRGRGSWEGPGRPPRPRPVPGGGAPGRARG